MRTARRRGWWCATRAASAASVVRDFARSAFGIWASCGSLFLKLPDACHHCDCCVAAGCLMVDQIAALPCFTIALWVGRPLQAWHWTTWCTCAPSWRGRWTTTGWTRWEPLRRAGACQLPVCILRMPLPGAGPPVRVASAPAVPCMAGMHQSAHPQAAWSALHLAGV